MALNRVSRRPNRFTLSPPNPLTDGSSSPQIGYTPKIATELSCSQGAPRPTKIEFTRQPQNPCQNHWLSMSARGWVLRQTLPTTALAVVTHMKAKGGPYSGEPLPYLKRIIPAFVNELFTSIQAIAGSATTSLTVSSYRRPSDLVLPVSYPPVGPSRRHARPWAAAVRRKASHGISLAHVMR
jgi:hypothetical protein